MKRIAYTRSDGGLSIVTPADGARLAHSITLASGETLSEDAPVPVDRFLRHWPVDSANVEWAETEDEFLARVIAKSVPVDASDVRVIEDTDVPTDRTFRNAWRHDGARVTIDMPRAREIHRERLREMRAPKLATLDVEYMRADEAGDEAKKREIAAEKKKLRDITDDPAIEGAATPEALKALL